jgi:hypothetical protein
VEVSRLFVVVFLLAAPIMRGQQGGGAIGDPVVTFKVFFNQMEIGALTGVSYDEGKYLLYATKPEPGRMPVILYRDTVVQLGRLVMALGGDDPGAGMSLDFIPDGRHKYSPEDVLDVPRFAEILRSDRKLAVTMRTSPAGAEVLNQCMVLKKDEKPSKALRGRIADLLNQTRGRSDVQTLIDPNKDLLPETQVFLKTVREPLQRARIQMDDFFQGAVDKDIAEKYQVVYKAGTPEAQEKIRPMLVNTRVSAIWTSADTRLKMMVAGKEGLGFKIGPPQQVLCAEEMQRQLARGVDLNTGQFVDYLRLVVGDYEDMGGVGVWFRNPTLEALAGRVSGKETPTCAVEWSARLSKRMPWILQQEDPVAADLRALLQILLLHRAVVYLFQTAPMGAERLNLLQRDAGDLPSDPPKVVKSEIAFGAHGEAHVLKTAGGIDWGGKNPAPHPPKAAGPVPVNQGPLRDSPGFLVTDMPDGQMRIDITSILAPS